ncbi:MAG: 1-acyl-sn-glycerol-3-phosphate acyltransferase [Bacteroidota bacterium]
MTILYRIYKTIVPLISRAYFGKISKVNEDRVHRGDAIIFVANHPSALMDPVICGSFTSVPIHFLGRADLFKKRLSNWFLRNSHMWPIYRDVDGRENLDKNEAVFKECYASLKQGSPILLYGEGFTDEQFIRRVKKIKKGPSRIAFGAEEAYDFKLRLKIIPLGINYSDPDVYGSDLLLRYGEPIEVGDLKDLFTSNPVKAMLDLTRQLEVGLLKEVIHIDKKERTSVAERILELDEHHIRYSHLQGAPSLEDRWSRTKQVVDRMNAMPDDQFTELAERSDAFWKSTGTESGQRYYFVKLLQEKRLGISMDVLLLILSFPMALAGSALNFPVFILLNFLPGKLTRRTCFHPGMKIVLSMLLFPMYLLIPYNLLGLFVDTSWWMYFPFLIVATLLGHIALRTRQRCIHFYHKWRASRLYDALENKDAINADFRALRSLAGW